MLELETMLGVVAMDRLLKQFLTELDDRMQAVMSFGDGDIDDVYHNIHMIRYSAEHFGFERLAECAERVGQIRMSLDDVSFRNRTNRRILVAEDSKPNQLVVTAMLERNGFEVDVANNGTEACAWVKKKGHGDSAYGLILMDVQMPGMDGTEAARWIRNNGYDVPINALTAKAFVEDEKNCLEAGMNDFMTKPVDYKALLSRVDMWLGVAGSGVSLPSEKAQELRSLMGDRAFADALRVFSEDVRRTGVSLGGIT